MAVPFSRTVDGFESQIGTNHLGHFALTMLLLPHIGDRVVTVSSGIARIGRVDLDDLSWERRRYGAWRAYAQSKRANLLFTHELNRRLVQGSTVRALAAHPGIAATRLQRRTGRPLRDIVAGATGLLGRCRARRTADVVRGDGRDPRRSLRRARRASDDTLRARGRGLARLGCDPEIARRLFDLSVELTGAAQIAMASGSIRLPADTPRAARPCRRPPRRRRHGRRRAAPRSRSAPRSSTRAWRSARSVASTSGAR